MKNTEELKDMLAILGTSQQEEHARDVRSDYEVISRYDKSQYEVRAYSNLDNIKI